MELEIRTTVDFRYPYSGKSLVLRDYQQRAFNDPSKKKIYWFSRRTGKTILVAVEAIKTAVSDGGNVLILCPSQGILRNTRDVICDVLDSSKVGFATSKNQVNFSDGSTIFFYTLDSGFRACGLDAKKVIVCEADWTDRETFLNSIVDPILYSREGAEFIVAGTPKRDPNSYMHKLAKDKEFSIHHACIFDMPNGRKMAFQCLKDFHNTDQFVMECLAPLP